MIKKEKKKIGEVLKEAGLIDDFQLNSALSYQKTWGGRLGSIIIRKGFVSEHDVVAVLSKQFNMPCISLKETELPAPEILDMIKPDIAKKFCIFPLGMEGKTLMVAVVDPTDFKMLDDLSFTTGIRMKPMLALESEIITAIDTNYYGKYKKSKYIIEKEDSILQAAQQSASPRSDDLIRNEVAGRAEPAIQETGMAKEKSRTEVPQRAVIESIIDLLISKGVFTKDEILNQIRSRMRQ